jgi:hypothetical protein
MLPRITSADTPLTSTQTRAIKYYVRQPAFPANRPASDIRFSQEGLTSWSQKARTNKDTGRPENGIADHFLAGDDKMPGAGDLFLTSEDSTLQRPEVKYVPVEKREKKGTDGTSEASPVATPTAGPTPKKFGYLAPPGTFGEQVGRRIYGSEPEGVPYPSNEAVVKAVAEGEVEAGVVPVWNSRGGAVQLSLNSIRENKPKIDGHLLFPIRHNGMRKENNLDGVKTVSAHEQAIRQCAEHLDLHLPAAKRVPVSSNAEGARLASLDSSVVGIAGADAASTYGLHIVLPDIQDDANNRTQFVSMRPRAAVEPASAE